MPNKPKPSYGPGKKMQSGANPAPRQPRGKMQTGGSQVVKLGDTKVVMEYSSRPKTGTKFKPLPAAKKNTVKPFAGQTGRKPASPLSASSKRKPGVAFNIANKKK